VADLVPKPDEGDPPQMDGDLAAIYQRKFSAIAEQFAAYARQIGRSAQR
jgi:hypothetical protein